MFELLAFVTIGFLVFGLLALAFKTVVVLILLPLKLGLLMFKGLIGLILVVPAVIIAVCVAVGVVPVLLAIIAVPVLACVGLLACLFA